MHITDVMDYSAKKWMKLVDLIEFPEEGSEIDVVHIDITLVRLLTSSFMVGWSKLLKNQWDSGQAGKVDLKLAL